MALRVRGVVCAVLVPLGAVLEAALLGWAVVVGSVRRSEALVWIAAAVLRLLRRTIALRGILVVALLLVVLIVGSRHLRRDEVALVLVSSVYDSLVVDEMRR